MANYLRLCFLVLSISIIFFNSSYSQIKLSLNEKDTPRISLNGFKQGNASIVNTSYQKFYVPQKNSKLEKAQLNLFGVIMAMLVLPNPQIMLEDNKVRFGLTKQLSLLLFVNRDVGVGRLGFEYTYVFGREYHSNFRASYVQDVILNTGDFSMLLLSFEGGYFTDTDKKGVSASGALNILLGVFAPLYINPYIKLRHTFMLDNRSDITDFSIGAGIGLNFLY